MASAAKNASEVCQNTNVAMPILLESAVVIGETNKPSPFSARRVRQTQPGEMSCLGTKKKLRSGGNRTSFSKLMHLQKVRSFDPVNAVVMQIARGKIALVLAQ